MHRLVLALAVLVGLLGPAAAAEKAIIVLDGSGSMWAQIDGEARISIARQTLRSVLNSMPSNVQLGLMTYGHRDRGDCNDIELLVPPGPNTTDRILQAADGINPKGKTPISEAVRQAAVDLRYTEDKASVILITDGLETCEADPCALASELEKTGVDFTAYVLGLGLTEEEGKKVACIAENTGGQYIPAGDAEALTEALNTTVAAIAVPSMAPDPTPDTMEVAEAPPEPEPEPQPEPVISHPEPLPYNIAPVAVMSEDGEPLGENSGLRWEIYKQTPNGKRGEYVNTSYDAGYTDTLEPGKYVLVAAIDEAHSEQPLTISADTTSEPLFVLNATTLHIKPLRNAGDDTPADDASTVVHFPGGEATEYGEKTVVVPAGQITLQTTIGKGTATDTFLAKAGDAIDKQISVGVGRAVVTASYVAGMPVEADNLEVDIMGAKKAIDGSRKNIDTGYGPGKGFDLPAGDYVAVLTLGVAKAEAPFTVKSGEVTEVDGVLGAGVLAVTAPNASSVEVLSNKKDIQGRRKSIDTGYNTEYQTTLPAGNYVVKVTLQDGTEKEQDVSVTAGERSEISVE